MSREQPGIWKRLTTAGGAVRRSVGLYSSSEVTHALNMVKADALGFGRRSTVVTTDQYQVVDKVVHQPYSFLLLETYSENHPFLTIIHGAIIRSMIKNGWTSRAKFAVKCPGCGTEYKEPIVSCTTEINGRACGRKRLRKPSWDQRKRLDAFIQDPNLDDEMKDIIESVMKHVLATANGWLSISPLVKKEVAIYVENSANMYIGANKKARLGNGEYFCPRCFGAAMKGEWDKTYEGNALTQSRGKCELCGTALKETAYLHKEKYGGKVDARFGRDEIIHINSAPKLPQLYGLSKIPALLLQLRSASAMMRFNFNNYTMSRMAMIIALEGSNQEEANKIAEGVQVQETALNTQAAFLKRIGQITRSLRLLFLGSKKGLKVHPAMPDSAAMQSLEWMDWWFVKMCAAQYGVQPIYINVPSQGPGGYFQRMQVVVHAETTSHYQNVLSKPINEELLPIMGITDWEFSFNPIEPKDEREEAQIWREKIAAGQAAANAGLTALLNDDGELKISGVFKFNPEAEEGAAHVDNLPEDPSEPRTDGEEGLIPGSDQGSRGKDE